MSLWIYLIIGYVSCQNFSFAFTMPPQIPQHSSSEFLSNINRSPHRKSFQFNSAEVQRNPIDLGVQHFLNPFVNNVNSFFRTLSGQNHANIFHSQPHSRSAVNYHYRRPPASNNSQMDPLQAVINLKHNLFRNIMELKRYPMQLLMGRKPGKDYRKHGSCQYGPCRNVQHAVDTFFRNGFFG